MMFYVYLLKSKKDSKYYIGYTKDLKNRVEQHNKGRVSSTKRRIPMELIYYEAYNNKSAATNREKMLKRFGSSYGHLMKRAG